MRFCFAWWSHFVFKNDINHINFDDSLFQHQNITHNPVRSFAPTDKRRQKQQFTVQQRIDFFDDADAHHSQVKVRGTGW